MGARCVADRLLAYLRNTVDFSLKIDGRAGDLSMISWSDADWGTCKKTRRSISGGLVRVGATPVWWRSKKQQVVALSSCESEIIAASEVAREVIYLRRLLQEVLQHSKNSRQSKSATCSGRIRKAAEPSPVFWSKLDGPT